MMKSVLATMALLLSVSFTHTVCAADVSQEKKQLIDTLLAQTGQSAEKVGKLMASQYVAQIAKVLESANPDVQPNVMTVMSEEVNMIMNEEIVQNGRFTQLLYPIYDKHFTSDDLRKMIELNNTEFGKKLINVMPVITQEALKAGQEFGQSLAPKINERLQARFKKEGF
jgi:hypothetical protein